MCHFSMNYFEMNFFNVHIQAVWFIFDISLAALNALAHDWTLS